MRYERDMYEESEKVERSKDIFLNKNHHLRCFFYNIETISKDYRKNIIIPSKKKVYFNFDYVYGTTLTTLENNFNKSRFKYQYTNMVKKPETYC